MKIAKSSQHEDSRLVVERPDFSMFCVYLHANGNVLPGQPPKSIIFEYANGKIKTMPYSHKTLLNQIDEWCLLAEKMIETGDQVKNCETLLKDYVRNGIMSATTTSMEEGIPGLVQVYITSDNRIGGVVGLTDMMPFNKGGINCFLINPNLYGQGVGTKLFNMIKNDHNEKGICKGFYITACISSIPFWEKQGFKREDVEVLRQHFGEICIIEDTIIMSITF